MLFFANFKKNKFSDLKISGKEQMKLFKELLANTILYVKCFATKEIFKTLYECCGIIASCKFLDPKVANWLYDGNIYEKTFNDMVYIHIHTYIYTFIVIEIIYYITNILNYN